MATRGQTMRVTVNFGESIPSLETTLAGAPSSGDVLNLNDNLYRVETVTWNANPAPMRGSDLTLTVTPDTP